MRIVRTAIAAALAIVLALTSGLYPASASPVEQPPACGCLPVYNYREWLCPAGQKYILETYWFSRSTVRRAKENEGSCIFRKEEQAWLCPSAKVPVPIE